MAYFVCSLYIITLLSVGHNVVTNLITATLLSMHVCSAVLAL